MSADGTTQAPRVLGNRDRMASPPVDIATWTPPVADMVTRRTLPAPAPRSSRVVMPAQKHVEAAAPGGPASPAQSVAQSVAQPLAPGTVPRAPRPAWIDDGSVQALVWEHPDDAARVVRSLLVHANHDDSEIPALQRIAILCVALGHEPYGELLKFLGDTEIETVTQAVANLATVSVEMQAEVLANFEQQLRAGQWVNQGGLEYARSALERAVGPRKAKEILERVAAQTSPGFQMLKNATPEELTPFISHEHPQTIALILSQLEAQLSAGILDLLPGRIQTDVSYRIATMRDVTPAALNALGEAIAAMLRDIVGKTHGVGGPKVLADLLNLSSSTTEVTVLDAFDETDDEVAESVRNLMFTFDDIRHLSGADLKSVLDTIETDDLAVALKAAQEPLKEAVSNCVGDEYWQKLAERMEWMGPMRLGDVEQVQLRIVAQVRQLEEQGRVTIVRGPDVNHFV